MRTRRPGLVLGLLALAALPGAARAETPVWVSTVPVQTGADERVEVAPDGTAYAVIDHSRVLRSTDRGLTWTPVNPVPLTGVPLGGPEGGGSSDTFVAPLSAQVAVGSNGGAVSLTQDGGVTWSPVDVPPGMRSGYDSTSAMKTTGGAVWLVRGGFEVVNGCATLVPTTQVLTSRDGRSWRQSRLPVPDALVSDLAMRRDGRGAVAVWDMAWKKTSGSSGCGFAGEASSGLVYTTADAGRHWRRATSCPAVCTVAWTGSGRLVVASGTGQVRDSLDGGRTFRAAGTVPVLPAQVLGVQALDCADERCWALVNGTGIHRRDGVGEWQHEVSDADAPGLCVASLTAVDSQRVLAAGPHALMARVAAQGSAPAPTAGAAGPVRLAAGAVLGADGVARVRLVVPD